MRHLFGAGGRKAFFHKQLQRGAEQFFRPRIFAPFTLVWQLVVGDIHLLTVGLVNVVCHTPQVKLDRVKLGKDMALDVRRRFLLVLAFSANRYLESPLVRTFTPPAVPTQEQTLPMSQKIGLSSSLFVIYLVSVTFALALASYFYVVAWGGYIKDSGENTARDVAAVSGILKSGIAEGIRFVELAQQNVEKTVAAQHVDRTHLEGALNNGINSFRLLNDLESYGILFLADAQGKLMARSDRKPVEPTSFSDRFFYNAIVANPELKLVVGPMIQARTTGKTVFHVAVPIRWPDKQLFGVLALQLDVAHIIDRIHQELGSSGGVVTTVSNGDQVVLQLPLPDPALYGQNGMLWRPIGGLPAPTRQAQWFDLEHRVVAQIALPELKLAVYSDQGKRKIRESYTESYASSGFLILSGLLIYSALLYLLQKNIHQLARERISALTDRLTGLLNRRAFDERYQTLLREAHRNRQPVSVLFLDIDHFKQCNDRYGHDNGDVVLKKVADLICSSLHRPLDCCFRWGGEEMVCLLEDTDDKGAVMVAERILRKVRQTPIDLKGHEPCHVTVSIGIATAHYSEKPVLIDLVGAADHAMYRAKQAGRDRLDVVIVSE